MVFSTSRKVNRGLSHVQRGFQFGVGSDILVYTNENRNRQFGCNSQGFIASMVDRQCIIQWMSGQVARWFIIARGRQVSHYHIK